MSPPIRVGLLGAGPVSQAIHLPTIARREDCIVTRVMDVDGTLAASVAAWTGASATADEDELIWADDVDVVVVGSPPQHHARQVEAACRAGKSAVLCEKPLATSRKEGEHIARVSRESGVPVLVGAMHTFDPGWIAARDAWAATGDRPHTILSRVLLPPNAVFEDAASSMLRPARPAGAPSAAPSPAAMLRGGILGLAVHDLPLIRALVGPVDRIRVAAADVLAPFGYVVDLALDDVVLRLTAVTPTPWRPDWTLDVLGAHSELVLTFPPSYVHAGGTSALLRTGAATTILPAPEDNGYTAEWDAVVAAVRGRPTELDDALEDLRFALTIADAAADIMDGVPS